MYFPHSSHNQPKILNVHVNRQSSEEGMVGWWRLHTEASTILSSRISFLPRISDWISEKLANWDASTLSDATVPRKAAAFLAKALGKRATGILRKLLENSTLTLSKKYRKKLQSYTLSPTSKGCVGALDSALARL